MCMATYAGCCCIIVTDQPETKKVATSDGKELDAPAVFIFVLNVWL